MEAWPGLMVLCRQLLPELCSLCCALVSGPKHTSVSCLSLFSVLVLAQSQLHCKAVSVRWVRVPPGQISCGDSGGLLYFAALSSGSHLTWKPPEAASNKHPTAASPLGLKALGMRLQSFFQKAGEGKIPNARFIAGVRGSGACEPC